MIEELQSISVTPGEIPGLLPLRKIAPKKTKTKHVSQVCGSMRTKEMSNVQEMKAQEKEKEEKKKEKCTEEGRKKNCFHVLQR